MVFDEDGICVLESLTTDDECQAYVHFLGREGERHFIHQRDAQKWAEWHEGITAVRPEFHKAMGEFYRSAIRRAQDDLDGIERRIPQIEAHREKLCAEKTS